MTTDRNRAPVRAITQYALQLFLPLAVGLLLSACKPQAKVTQGGDLTGVYALVSVNGKNVPTSVSHEGTALQVRSGSFTIKADGTCGTKTIFVPPNAAETTQEVNATYTKEGSNLTMQWQGAGTTTGTVDGNTFTMENEG